MDFNLLIAQLKALLYQPEKGWEALKSAQYSWQQISGYFLMPLLFLSSLSVVFFFDNQESQIYFTPNQMFFITFAGSAGAIFAGAYLIAALAPRFNGISSFNNSFAWIAFAYSPVYLSSIISSIHPALQILNLVAMVFMLFLFFKGTSIMMNVPAHKQTGFTIVSLIIIFVTRLFLSVFTASILGVRPTL